MSNSFFLNTPQGAKVTQSNILPSFINSIYLANPNSTCLYNNSLLDKDFAQSAFKLTETKSYILRTELCHIICIDLVSNLKLENKELDLMLKLHTFRGVVKYWVLLSIPVLKIMNFWRRKISEFQIYLLDLKLTNFMFFLYFSNVLRYHIYKMKSGTYMQVFWEIAALAVLNKFLIISR